jgi:hypothetical protein
MKPLTIIIIALALSANAQQQLAELSGAQPGDNAGTSVILSSRGALLGAPGATQGTGAVYGYVIPKGGWQNMSQPSFTLTAPDGAPGDQFGISIAAAGSWIIVGAPGHANGYGALYFYQLSGGNQLVPVQEIVLSGLDAPCGLGKSVATSLSAPTWVLAAAPNCASNNYGPGAFSFQLMDGQWVLYNVSMNAPAGYTMTQVVMAYGKPNSGTGIPFMAAGLDGAVDVWQSGEVKGNAPDFGTAVSMQSSSSYMFVGEPSTGTVYIYYARSYANEPQWSDATLVGTLTDSNLLAGSGFGSTITSSGRRILVGAPAAGLVDEFDVATLGNITKPNIVYQSNGANFGQTIAWDIGKTPQTFIVGAPAESGSGVGYVEQR